MTGFVYAIKMCSVYELPNTVDSGKIDGFS